MLEIRLLGELEVERDGASVPLPASKKSRALLAYLAATRRPHLRERLCELLWDGPDDPRAALRWSLTKLRPLVEPHLVASRDRVELRCDVLDIARICTPSTATTEDLERCAAAFRGDFLDGLDLPACFRYQQWCVAERERCRQAHVAVLSELMRRYGASDAALRHARRRVIVDPFNEMAHAELIRLLGAHEALAHYEYCRQLFERELGVRPGELIEEARRRAGVSPAVGEASRLGRRDAAATAAGTAALPFVGRQREFERINAADRVLILGEPGIGKSRLVEELRPTRYTRAFAAEMVRPYGVWIDALHDFPTETDKARLFDAVVERLGGVQLLAIDDVQWLDEASAALLHYVARKAMATRIVCAARVGELDDNVHASRAVRDKRFVELRLGPLSDEETRALVADAENRDRVVAESGGNPLFALELARRGSTGGALTTVIADRLDRLDGAARELVAWAAAVGRQFDAEIVGRATGMPAGEMFAALEKLERAAIIRASGDRSYDFTHDLVRDAAYQVISGPRRALVHRHIGRALGATHDPDGALAGEIVRHASLAGDYEIAAEAAVAAGERCLRLFAYNDALAVARLGLQMVNSIETEMRLLHVVFQCRSSARDRTALLDRVPEVTERARLAGLAATAALGAHLLAGLNEELSNYRRAADATIESAELSRGANTRTAAYQIANAARCLLFLQRETKKAESLLAEATAMGFENTELALGWGYLHAHEGHHWREWIALARLVSMSLEHGQPQQALAYCERLRPLAAKMTGGSEGVRTEMLEALARFANGAAVDVAPVLAKLRDIDSKSDLAWALVFLAEIEQQRGDVVSARRHAEEALAAAEIVGRESDVAIARALLGTRPPSTANLTARARRIIKEKSHGQSRFGAELR